MEEASIELYLIRNLKNKIDKKNEDLTKEIKELMLDKLGARSYDGEKVQIEIGEQQLPREVITSVASQYIPFNDFLQMVSVNRKNFEAYLRSHNIELDEEQYLVDKGTMDVLKKPALKMPIQYAEEKFKELYNELSELITK